jgi:Mrp family chromosome partitioning ATPase
MNVNVRTITFIISGKGGAGKTTLAIEISAALRAQGTPHRLFSVEVQGTKLEQVFTDTTRIDFDEVEIWRGETGLDELFLAASKGQHVVADTGANSGRGILDWIRGVNLLDLCAEKGVRVTMAVVAPAADDDTRDFFSELYKACGDYAHWFLVRSLFTGIKFSIFNGIAAKAKATVIDIDQVVPRVIEMARERSVSLAGLARCKDVNILQRARALHAAAHYANAIRPLIEEFK